MFESRENTTESAAIFRFAVCINDITSKTGKWGNSVKYVLGQLFLLFTAKESISRAVSGGDETWSKKLLPFVQTLTGSTHN